MEKINIVQDKNISLSKRARSIIPGGAHTYSKGDDQFPANAPKVIDRAEGCYLYDVDGNKFMDYGMALGTTMLGYAHKPVVDAVTAQLSKGANYTRPSFLEAEVAEKVASIIPCAEMVKFTKNGSDATTAAVKLARAYTGRDIIARCANDPFNSTNDWFIGSTCVNRGVPQVIQDLTVTFKYNDLESCKALFNNHPNQIACFIFEPISMMEPEEGFLEGLQELCQKNGTLLIFDEVVSCFRFDIGGAQKMIGVIPDITALGKSLGNGFSISALVGKKEFMKLGGLDHDSERVFLLSTTHGAENHCLAAAKKVLEEMEKHKVQDHVWKIGKMLQDGVRAAITETGTEKYMDVIGYPCKPGFIPKDENGEVSMIARTLFLQETVARGLMFPYVSPSLSHTEDDAKFAINVIKDALIEMKNAATSIGMEKAVVGDIVKPVFRKYN